VLARATLAGSVRGRSKRRASFCVHSRGRLGLLLARRSQTVGSGPGVTGGMMSDQQSLSLGERGPGIVGPLPPEVTRDCGGWSYASCGPSSREKLIDVSRRLSKSALSLQVRAGRGDSITLGIENRDLITVVALVVKYKLVSVMVMCTGCHLDLLYHPVAPLASSLTATKRGSLASFCFCRMTAAAVTGRTCHFAPTNWTV
jgi:hypothetical protein